MVRGLAGPTSCCLCHHYHDDDDDDDVDDDDDEEKEYGVDDNGGGGDDGHRYCDHSLIMNDNDLYIIGVHLSVHPKNLEKSELS